MFVMRIPENVEGAGLEVICLGAAFGFGWLKLIYFVMAGDGLGVALEQIKAQRKTEVAASALEIQYGGKVCLDIISNDFLNFPILHKFIFICLSFIGTTIPDSLSTALPRTPSALVSNVNSSEEIHEY